MIDRRSMGEIRSNFSRTCRLLSQYLKQKGSFGGLALHMPPSPPDLQAQGELLAPTTMTLLPGVDVSETQGRGCPPKSMDLFPSDVERALKGQLTFFYGGRVVVFDDFPADKAEKLMRMASEEDSSAAARNFTFSAPATADCSPKLGYLTPAPQESLSKANAADMPIARKISLHRFLEKRKDRISGAAPYQIQISASATGARALQPILLC